eukprot:5736929-Prymnesium_polylepis.2
MTTMISARGFFIRAVAVGNSGFDPLGLSSPETLVPLRQAEIKHGRRATTETHTRSTTHAHSRIPLSRSQLDACV